MKREELLKKYDLKIGAVVTPRELANVFNYHYMKNVMGIAYDSMNYIYIVRTQGG